MFPFDEVRPHCSLYRVRHSDGRMLRRKLDLKGPTTMTSDSRLNSPEGVADWRSFEAYARQYFSELWGVDLRERSVNVGDAVPWRFDLVSEDRRYVGDAKWLKNIRVPAAKWQAIAECIWLLQKVPSERVFMVFGRDVEVAARYLGRVRSLTEPVEFYFLDDSGHRAI